MHFDEKTIQEEIREDEKNKKIEELHAQNKNNFDEQIPRDRLETNDEDKQGLFSNFQDKLTALFDKTKEILFPETNKSNDTLTIKNTNFSQLNQPVEKIRSDENFNLPTERISSRIDISSHIKENKIERNSNIEILSDKQKFLDIENENQINNLEDKNNQKENFNIAGISEKRNLSNVNDVVSSIKEIKIVDSNSKSATTLEKEKSSSNKDEEKEKSESHILNDTATFSMVHFQSSNKENNNVYILEDQSLKETYGLGGQIYKDKPKLDISLASHLLGMPPQ